jgi:hypothetical protein
MKSRRVAIHSPSIRDGASVQASAWARRLSLILAAAVVCGTCVPGLADEPTGLGERVVQYCKQHKGKRVGNGSCTILALAALQSAGARMRGPDNPDSPGHGRANDFNWGELIFVLERSEGSDFKVKGQIKDVRPGDIIQYTNTTLTGAFEDYGTYTTTARHHTAIVSDILENGAVLKIYEQRANGRKRVSLTSLRLADLQSGRFAVYHPMARIQGQSPQKTPTSDRPTATPPR